MSTEKLINQIESLDEPLIQEVMDFIDGISQLATTPVCEAMDSTAALSNNLGVALDHA